MLKASFTIVALFSLLAFLLNLQQYDTASKEVKETENKLTATRQKSKQHLSASTQNLGRFSLDQNKPHADAMIADGKLAADPISLRMDYLLVTDKLTDFSEAELSNISAICRNKRHHASDLACTVYQHWSELTANDDGVKGGLESVWAEAELNAGVEFEENTEITQLTAKQITRESGGPTDNLESMRQSLQDNALHDPSDVARYNAIRDAIAMKDPASIPLLESASNDENPVNAKLAAQGLKDVQKTLSTSIEPPDDLLSQKILSDMPYLSEADVASK